MRVFKSKKGSSSVEAAFVIPIVVLVICGLLSVSLKLYKQVYDESKTITETYTEEDSLRGRWVLK